MYLLKMNEVSMEVDGKPLFQNVSIEVKENERVALIGENGTGKTTLIKGILGIESINNGQISCKVENYQIGYILQESDIDVQLPLKDWVMHDHPNYFHKVDLEAYTEQMQYSSHPIVIEKYNESLKKYLGLDGYQWEIKVEKLLHQIGLYPETWAIPFSKLSGGQKTKAKLTKMMLLNPKLIILDEPTNHLDLQTTEWLGHWLLNYKGTVLFISHERSFIDQIATSTYELTDNGTKRYSGGYSSFKKQKELELKTQTLQYEKQEQERKKLSQAIQQYKQWYVKASSKASVRDPYAQKKTTKHVKKYKAKEKALERLKENEITKPAENPTIKADITPGDFFAKDLIRLENVSKSYEKYLVIQDVNLHLERGDRLAVIGENGSGKTTLLKLMIGLIKPNIGEVKHHPQIKIGHFSQELQNINTTNTILDEIMEIPRMKQSDARNILASFLFRKEDVFKQISDLSMGEKCRIAFVKLYFSNANLLVLDEPTNYFDIPSREIIEEALVQYPGSIVMVTHDPYLLRKISNKVVSLKNKQANLYLGSYQEWEEHKMLSPKQQQLKNELERLELKYSELLASELDDDSLLNEIQSVKERIGFIQDKLNN
ncbi:MULTISPECIES: ribosomal protection-like ABC-F family protein [Allobacillus]|uniref:ABC-F type ribosomal protection protein n=1 Tax=Allobacillus salarius TaxID=1955272 RepID=A0A556PA43_9BACI|nr:ABC-F type ribosomal protection protein [Allobacillus salarius]TSJ61267.1 ABC-F type ribosomal protection protein [Allobacillus salarius]